MRYALYTDVAGKRLMRATSKNLAWLSHIQRRHGGAILPMKGVK
jgi:hypothetical protein